MSITTHKLKMSVRIKVCLSKIFKDQRHKAYVNVDPSFLYVHNLEEHIRKIFDIKQRIFLTIDGVLLPSNENIQVVHSGDLLIVNTISSNANTVYSGGNVSTASSIELEICSTHSTENSTVTVKGVDDFPKRGKRIRKRKRKTKNEILPPKVDEPDKVQMIVKNKFATKEVHVSSIISHTKSNSHIRFSNNGNATSPKSGNDLNELVQPSVLPVSTSTLPSTARVIRPQCVYSESLPPEHLKSNELESPICTDKLKQNLITLKGFASDANFKSISDNIDFEVIRGSIEKNKDFVTLEDKLQTSDIIGFKILKINNSYMPELSNWIIGMVTEIVDQNVSMRVLAGKDETAFPTGKLSMEFCDQSTDSSTDLMTFTRNEILYAKVFKQ